MSEIEDWMRAALGTYSEDEEIECARCDRAVIAVFYDDDENPYCLACLDQIYGEVWARADAANAALDRVRVVAASIWAGTSGGMFTVLADLTSALGISISDLGRPAVPLDAFDDLPPDERAAAVATEMDKRRAALSEPTEGEQR